MPTPTEERLKMLDSITGLGLFRNYVWDSAQLKEFDRYNLIYGWNYSGKTTLSLVFQSIEDGRLHRDFIGADFQFTKGDGSTISSAQLTSLPSVRVFNREFILRNFHEGTDMTGAKLLVVIGETNQLLKDRLKLLQSRVQKISDFRIRLTNEKNSIQRRLDNTATAQARTVIQIVGGPYTRTHLLTHTIPGLPKNYTPLPLSNENLDAEKEQFRRAGDFEKVSLFKPNHKALLNIVFKIRSVLKEIATNIAVESLQEDRNLEKWVETGLEVNIPGAPCGFCGGAVSKERWVNLKGHFSEAFSRLQIKLQQLKIIIAGLDFEAPTLNETTLFPELRQSYLDALTVTKDCLAQAATAATSIETKIGVKLENLESVVTWNPDLTTAKKLRKSIKILNSVLKQHNKKVTGADEVRSIAKGNICQHFAVFYLKEQNVTQCNVKSAKINSRISQCNRTLNTIDSQILRVRQAIKDASIAAQKVNENLSLLLPGDDIEAVKLNDTDFEFQRSGRVATHMSEGERTAVALSYFLAKLEEGSAPLEESIVVLDDPISSLDENHIYAVHSICENRLANARQLFVLTHNSSFFGMTKDWMKGKASSFYMIQRGQNSNKEWFSEIVPLPTMLYKFKSNYQYTYCRLKLINDNQNPTLEDLAAVPNMIRSLLEAYLGFIFPEKGSLVDKLPRIISCEESCGKVLKFANENSHAHSLTQVTEIAAYITHGKQVVGDVLSAIQSHNPDHIASLETEFQNEAGNLP